MKKKRNEQTPSTYPDITICSKQTTLANPGQGCRQCQYLLTLCIREIKT
jgi:hypothetical protein